MRLALLGISNFLQHNQSDSKSAASEQPLLISDKLFIYRSIELDVVTLCPSYQGPDTRLIMTPSPVSIHQRKQGIGLLKPVSWNNGRRFTSPGPGPVTRTELTSAQGMFSVEVSTEYIFLISPKVCILYMTSFIS